MFPLLETNNSIVEILDTKLVLDVACVKLLFWYLSGPGAVASDGAGAGAGAGDSAGAGARAECPGGALINHARGATT